MAARLAWRSASSDEYDDYEPPEYEPSEEEPPGYDSDEEWQRRREQEEYDYEPQERERRHTALETSRLIGISYITIKRWIYAGKVDAEKDRSGRWRISDDEVGRLREEARDYLAEGLLQLLNQKRVAYIRELQVCMESEFPHIDTANKLRELGSEGRVKRKKFKYKDGTRYVWYWRPEESWDDVRKLAAQRKKLVDLLHAHEKKFEHEGQVYADYSEFLVEQAFVEAGYTVVDKDVYHFNGKTWKKENPAPGRPEDLDFVVLTPNRNQFVGVSVKNKAESTPKDDVDQLIAMCRFFGIKPLLITRMAGPRSFIPIREEGGWIVVFKRLLVRPPFDPSIFKDLLAQGFPVAVYKRVPTFLVRALSRAAENLA